MQLKKGAEWSTYPSNYRYGTIIKKKEALRTGTDNKGQQVTAMRKETVYQSFDLNNWYKGPESQLEWFLSRALPLNETV